MISKNIVILAGSPRKESSMDRLVAAFTEGAKGAGHTVTTFRAADMKVGGYGSIYTFVAKNFGRAVHERN